MKKNWVKLVILNNIKDIIRVFGNIFLSIYFFNATEGNLAEVLKYWLVYSASNLIYRYAICKFLNTNNIIKLYRLSLFANLITVSILLVLRENIINYIYMFALLQSFAISLYYATYENITCNINKNNDYKKYFSIDSLLANIISIIVPLCLGILIETYSYIVAFAVLFIITMICFIYSLFLNNEKIECEKIQVLEYLKSIKNKKIYTKTLIQNFFDGFNTWGPVGVLTTVVIYSQISNEGIVGGINSISNIIGVLFSILCIKVINKKNFGKLVIPTTIIIFLLTVPISIKFSVILVFIYIILNQIGVIITDINGNSLTYELKNEITEEKYQNTYLWNIQVIFDIGRIVGYSLVLIVATYWYDYLKYLFIIFSLGFVIRSIVINSLIKFSKSK